MARRLPRREVAGYVAKRLIEGDEKAVQQLAAYLIDSKQVGKLDIYVRAVESELSALGYVVANVTSAFSLSEDTKKQITELLKEDGAKEVVLRERVDESVLGGVQIETPEHSLDMTVASKLNKLRNRYKKA